jgi:ATP-dependent DNA ligase
MQISRIKSIKKSTGKDRFDLEVDDNHNLFANGILVHNCRLLATKEDGVVRMWSRKGKEISIPNKISEELKNTLLEGEVTDGEVYVHGWSFQRIVSAVKKKVLDTDLLEYHIYDFPSRSKSFKERFVDPDKARFSGRLKIVKTDEVTNNEDIDQNESSAISSGYEGLMFRTAGSKYKYKFRSDDLLKIKRFEDAEFKIIGGKEGQGREVGMVVFKCETSNGTEFDVRPRGTAEERSLMWDNLNSYIGKPLTVKYQGLTDEGKPRFPVGLHVRPDWD